MMNLCQENSSNQLSFTTHGYLDEFEALFSSTAPEISTMNLTETQLSNNYDSFSQINTCQENSSNQSLFTSQSYSSAASEISTINLPELDSTFMEYDFDSLMTDDTPCENYYEQSSSLSSLSVPQMNVFKPAEEVSVNETAQPENCSQQLLPDFPSVYFSSMSNNCIPNPHYFNTSSMNIEFPDTSFDVSTVNPPDRRSLLHVSQGMSTMKKKAKPWTKKEHFLFLIGLHRCGKGDWKNISRKYVRTKTPSQLASHAQKFHLRQQQARHKRPSIHDITTVDKESEAQLLAELSQNHSLLSVPRV